MEWGLKNSMKRILFVCIENAGRSQLAEAISKHLGKGEWEVWSAGSQPADALQPGTLNVLQAHRIESCGLRPKHFDDVHPSGPWDYVITMGCEESCPPLPAVIRRDWGLVNLKDQSSEAYERLFLEVERRVNALLEEVRGKRIPQELLRWRCDPQALGELMASVKLNGEIVGQPRALEALRIGLEVSGPGYNVFVAGTPGTGRLTAIKKVLRRAKRCGTPEDRCYVNNFKDPDHPRLLTMPPGKGVQFKRDMQELSQMLREQIPHVFEEQRFKHRRKSIIDMYADRQQELMKPFEKKVEKSGFSLTQVQAGNMTQPDILPIIQGVPMTIAQLSDAVEAKTLPEDQAVEWRNTYSVLREELDDHLRKSREINHQMHLELKTVEKKVCAAVIKTHIDDLRERYSYRRVKTYLEEVKDHLLEHLDIFKERPEGTPPESVAEGVEVDPFLDYEVNVVLDASLSKRCPVVIETNPSFTTLFGTIDRVFDQAGRAYADFTRIKGGSLLKADSGYLVLMANDVAGDGHVWTVLKRIMKTGLLEIQIPETATQAGTVLLKPEPIEVNVKVILIGDLDLYQMLYANDGEFEEIFKIRADFDIEMERNPENIKHFASVIRTESRSAKLLTLTQPAMASLVEYAVRMSGSKRKITTKFSYMLDIVREASYWGEADGDTKITEVHLDKAIGKQFERNNLFESKLQEMITDGVLVIEVDGAHVGQVNGLTVYDVGSYQFGKPVRITASASIGKAGVINVDREAEMSGPIHNKGMLILSGYFRHRYAQNKPLSLSASITFEQSYSEIEGDSASAAELFALCSTLAGVPLKQGIAVTGAVDQHGRIQAVGGINYKIEGFFDVCRAKGVTGQQGVMIPGKNIQDLMLRREVLEAVEQGIFHIYQIESVDEGLEILTGWPAGKADEHGEWPENTLNGRIDRRLKEFADRLKEFER